MSILGILSSDWRITLFVVLVVLAFLWNGINRIRWELAWNASGHRGMPIPETRWTYNAQDIEEFAETAARAGLLDGYVKEILRRSDICFAIALAAITAFLWYLIAVTPMDWVFLNWVALPLGAMAVLYGIADVAEDIKLAAILGHGHAIDSAEVAATNMLTRLKMATLTLSVIGVAIFLVIRVLQALAVRMQGGRPIPA